ncbi:MAG: hypothetical protein H6732_03170 [Alphaproteobacteria bacterium]|nr:hypothetical protein [Alphaproteobacteria bacterium]
MSCIRLLLPWGMLACAPARPLVDPLLDTGWFDDGPWELGCRERLVEVAPGDGAERWYWRTPPRFTVTQPWEGYQAQLSTSDGLLIPSTLEVSDDGLTYTVRPDEALAPDAEHVLELEDCDGRTELRFTTSTLGLPLEGGTSSLSGRTWQLDLARATWLQPGGFGPTLGGFLESAPILVGVRLATDDVVRWIGTNGTGGTGGITQSIKYPTWAFPTVPFGEAPYFEVETAGIELAVGDSLLPISELRFTGTFSADGTRIGGATLSGSGDTRFAGGAAGNAADPGAFCQLAEGLGVQCEPCADGKPYCMTVEVVDLSAPEVPGLTLVPVILETAP